MFGWATIACSAADIMAFVVNEHQLFSTVVRGRVAGLAADGHRAEVSETFLAVAWARPPIASSLL